MTPRALLHLNWRGILTCFTSIYPFPSHYIHSHSITPDYLRPMDLASYLRHSFASLFIYYIQNPPNYPRPMDLASHLGQLFASYYNSIHHQQSTTFQHDQSSSFLTTIHRNLQVKRHVDSHRPR